MSMIQNPGSYIVRATAWDFGQTSKGTDQVAVTFEVQPGEPEAGNTITWYGYFSEKATKRTLEGLKHAGWTGKPEDFETLAGMGTKDCIVEVELDTYEGKTRPKVKWVNSLDGGGGAGLKAPLDPAARKSFAARMKGELVAFAREGGAPAARPQAAPPVSDQSTDGIPF